MTSRYRIIRSQGYAKDYEKEVEYSVKNWGDDHADKYFRDLESRIKTLEDNPHINAPKPNLPKDVRYFHHKGHCIIYKVDDLQKEITMLRMLGRDQFHKLEKEVQLQKEQTRQNKEQRTEKRQERENQEQEDPIERRMREHRESRERVEEKDKSRDKGGRGDRSR